MFSYLVGLKLAQEPEWVGLVSAQGLLFLLTWFPLACWTHHPVSCCCQVGSWDVKNPMWGGILGHWWAQTSPQYLLHVISGSSGYLEGTWLSLCTGHEIWVICCYSSCACEQCRYLMKRLTGLQAIPACPVRPCFWGCVCSWKQCWLPALPTEESVRCLDDRPSGLSLQTPGRDCHPGTDGLHLDRSAHGEHVQHKINRFWREAWRPGLGLDCFAR